MKVILTQYSYSLLFHYNPKTIGSYSLFYKKYKKQFSVFRIFNSILLEDTCFNFPYFGIILITPFTFLVNLYVSLAALRLRTLSLVPERPPAEC